MQPAKSYVRQDEHGVLRVGDTRVMLDSVIAAFYLGHSAETIAQQYPAVSLEEVYGAITHYLANQAEVDQYLSNQDELWSQWREKANAAASPVVQRLRALAAGTRDECAMSRPRFLADHDLNEHIVSGVLRQEPLIDFLRVRDLGMTMLPDD